MFTVGKDTFDSVVDYRNKVFDQLKKNGDGSIDPRALFGYREGTELDFDAYEQIGLPHPKYETPNYYKAERDVDGNWKGHPEFLEILLGIEKTKCIEDEITVLLHNPTASEKYIFILDGATRTQSFSYLRPIYPSEFQKIRVKVARESFEDAKFTMVRRNLEGRSRPLTDFELMQACSRWRKAGLEENDILHKLGKPQTFLPVIYNLLKISDSLIPELKVFFQAKAQTRQFFIEASKLPIDEQKALVLTLAGGDGGKMKAKDVKKKNTDQVIRIAPRIKAINEKFEDIETAMIKEGLDKDRELNRLYEEAQKSFAVFQGAYEQKIREREGRTVNNNPPSE